MKAQAQGAPASPSPAAATSGAVASPAAVVDEKTLSLDSPATVSGTQASADNPSLAPRSTVWDLIQMVLVLVFVILVIYFVFRLVKRGGKAKEAPAGGLVTLVSSTPLANGRYLHLVKMGPRILLVGSSESAVNLVAEVEDKETLDAAMLEAEAAQSSPKKDFGSILGQLLGPAQAKHPKNQGGPLDFLKKQRDRLNKYK